MNATVKRLLAKKKLSGIDIGRLLIANLIDIYNGNGLPQEKIISLMQSLHTEQDSIDYGLYRKIFVSIDETRDLYVEKMKQANLACIGLRTFYEVILFVSTNNECLFEKYIIDNITQETRDKLDYLWFGLRNSIQSMIAIKGAIEAAGTWLKIPKLESILPNDKELKLQVNNLNKFARQVRVEFGKLKLKKKTFIEVELIIQLCDFYSNLPSKDDILKAAEIFSVNSFEYNLEDAIAMMNPYYELDV